MKKIVISLLVFVLFASIVSALPNPASVYCEEQGYRLELRTSEEGQYGVCVFLDGNECEEWTFYNGACGQEYKKTDPGTKPQTTVDLRFILFLALIMIIVMLIYYIIKPHVEKRDRRIFHPPEKIKKRGVKRKR